MNIGKKLTNEELSKLFYGDKLKGCNDEKCPGYGRPICDGTMCKRLKTDSKYCSRQINLIQHFVYNSETGELKQEN